MHKAYPYIVFLALLLVVQVFLFDNLQISTYLSPLIYVAFLVLLPIETPPIGVLLCALGTGVAMDVAMGTAGINTIATLPVAVLRPSLLRAIVGREALRDGGIPAMGRLGRGGFLRYAASIVAIHHFLFFAMESLSLGQMFHTLVRLLVSGTVTLLFVWLIAQIFTHKLTKRS